MGTLYDKIKSKSGSTTATVSKGSTGGSLYDRIKNKQTATATTPFDTRQFVQRLTTSAPAPTPKKPKLESVSSYSSVAPKNFGLGTKPEVKFEAPRGGVPLPDLKTAQSTEATPTRTLGLGEGVLGGAKAVGRFAQEIPRGIAGTSAQGAAYVAGIPQENVSLDPTQMGPLGTFLLGKDKIEPAKEGSALLALIPGISDETAKKFGPGAYALLTISDFLTGPGKKQAALETIKTLNDVKGARRYLKDAGIADDVITKLKLDTKAVAAKTDAQAEAIFREAIEATGKKTPASPVVRNTEAEPVREVDNATPAEIKLTTNKVKETATEISVPKTTLYHGADKKVTPVTKAFEKVLSFPNDQYDVIKAFANAGDVRAQKILNDVVGTKIDYRRADNFIRSRYANTYDAIEYKNSQLPTKGAEYHDLKRNQFLTTDPEVAKVYSLQTRKETAAKVAETLPQLPALPKLPQETIRALEKPQVDATINEAIMNRYREAARKPVTEDTALAQAAKEPSKGDGIKKLTGELLTPIASRLGRINPELKTGLRKFEYEVASKTTHDSQEVLPLLKATQKMTPEDQALFDIARKNGDSEVIDALAKRYGIEEELERTRDVLDSIFERAKEVGMEINYRKDYFPRMIKNPQKFVAYLRKDPDWSTIRQLIEEAAKKKGIKYTDLSDEEMSSIVNGFIRGYGDKVTLAKPGFTKARTLEVLDDKLNEFYESSDSALSAYVIRMNDEIEGRKFFGKNLNTEVGDANIQDSIGSYVMRLVADGKIKPDQEKEVADILKARFHRGKMNGALDVYRNLEYLSTMGSPISAITQIGDLAFSLFDNGFWNTARGFGKSLKKTGLTKEDLGIENITQEFTKDTFSGQALDTVFKYTGMTKMDRLGKETLVNSYLLKLKDQAVENSDVLKRELDRMFDPEEAKMALEELKNGEITERTKYLAFNRLLDFQPVAKSEMPQKYLEMPNGRIFYMLKSYSIKQIDVFRTQAIDKIIEGDVKGGMKNLLYLSGALIAANATADEIKDTLLGRETPLSDKVVDNLWRLVGASKYDVYKARTDGVGQTVLKKILFPSSIADNVYKDVTNFLQDKKYEKGPMKGEDYKLESVQSIPLAGKLYYWWFGRGDQKEEYKQGGSSDSGLPGLPPLPKLPSLPALPKI